jgi:hypothetical protein
MMLLQLQNALKVYIKCLKSKGYSYSLNQLQAVLLEYQNDTVLPGDRKARTEALFSADLIFLRTIYHPVFSYTVYKGLYEKK